MRTGWSIFLGLLLLLTGLSILLNVFFQMELPVFRLVVAAVFIYIGGVVLLSVLNIRNHGAPLSSETVVLHERDVHVADQPLAGKKLNVILGHSTLDLARVLPRSGVVKVAMNIILGEGIVRFDPELPLCVEAQCALADCRMPDGNHVIFGQLSYRTPSYHPAKPAIVLKLTTVLGVVRFESYATPRAKQGMPLADLSELHVPSHQMPFH